MVAGAGGGRVVTDPPGYVCLRRLNPAGAGDRLFLARRLVNGAEVVLRLFDRTVGTMRDRQRFEHEVSGIKSLDDIPYVLPLIDADVRPDGQPYMVTAYCVAGSLQDHVVAMGRMSTIEVRRVGAKLAGALAQVHQRDIVHRNITPSNVLIDAAGEPALTDFGLVALSISGDFWPEPGRERTPFLAPEAYLPELMSTAADVYALGITLYALLAGTGPCAAHLARLPVAGEHLPDLPRVSWALMTVLRQAMALDPRDRFASAADLHVALLAAG